jgi:hypothetical protein
MNHCKKRLVMSSDNGDRDRKLFKQRIKTGSVMAKALASGPVIALVVALIWGGITVYFDVEVLAGEVQGIKEAVREQARDQSRNQREINQQLTEQARTNGEIQATQKAIHEQLQYIINVVDQRRRF